ncbi:MAG: hypothetical protein IJ710_09565 [Prevotella sp.]|nr:hypothetical protein [Prevotella sp.]
MEKDLRDLLNRRLHQRDIRLLGFRLGDEVDGLLLQQTIELMLADDGRTGCNAAWVLTYLPRDKYQQLMPFRSQLMTEAMSTASTTKCRLILTLLLRLPFDAASVRTDFLDFCLGHLLLADVPVGIRSVCLHLSCQQVQLYPELSGELLQTLDQLEQEPLSAALVSSVRRVRKQLQHRL